MVDVLLGLQWGDEGKGKVVDVLTPQYDIIARFQGGPNAGHTLEFDGIKHVLHTIPSGVFHDNKMNVIGNGVVIDPVIFKKEVEGLDKLNVNLKSNLVISNKAQLILPSHRLLDAANEKYKGDKKIGSTLKGIGPTYKDKIGRTGIRVGDIFREDFKEKYDRLTAFHIEMLRFLEAEADLGELEKEWFDAIENLKSFEVIESELFINEKIKEGKRILAEGAQGSLLDIDFGSYPYVTSSNTISAGACIGLGIAPSKIGKVFGIFKAYCTRVGSGPFPTELHNNTGEKLRKYGHEFGATTGRPRRCGWLDLPTLKYAIMLNGVSELIMAKVDVLSEFEKIDICTSYVINGNTHKIISIDTNQAASLKPQYKDFQGWQQDISNLSSAEELPQELLDYISFIEKEVNVPITLIGTGPDRTQILSKQVGKPSEAAC